MTLRQAQHAFSVTTEGQGFYEITDTVRRFVADAGLATGLVTVFIGHTSASLVIQENADPDVRRDLSAFFRRLVPEGDPLYVHTDEGPDDMPAHVRAALTASSLAVPITGGAPALGTWQGVYVFEHRRARHRRRVTLHAVGA